MKNIRLPHRCGFLLKPLVPALVAISLTGCLSGGGGGSDDAPAQAAASAVSTTEGDIKGISMNGMRVFRGIPYAEPPVGEFRFAPPEPLA